MEEVKTLVTRAQGGDRESFAALVRRFQDMAVAYAYTVLGDFHLAEDAAQEAFVGAYLDLANLCQPAAFAGWLRRIVFGRCTRVTRARKLDIVPLDLAGQIASPVPDPGAYVEARELKRMVRDAVEALPEHQRQATALFYISDYSHREIAAFLEVPATTVKKRLHDARKRLKENMVDMMKDDLQRRAPSRSQGFAGKVLEGIQVRPGDSTLISAFHPMLKAVGDERSIAHLCGVLGHAFSFMMNKDGGEIWQQSNIDWGLFWEQLDLLGRDFHRFDAVLKGARPAPSAEELKDLKEETWSAVVQSINRGAPAVAWQPMTLAQRDSGVSAYEWGLLIGYDEGERTYTVRHPRYTAEYTVPYDQFGYTDPVNWYHVLVLGAAKPIDPISAAVKALEQAIAFAYGTRYAPDEALYQTNAVGFAACELWRQALDSGKANLRFAPAHADILRWLRLQAATYLREIVGELPEDARSPLKKAATAYEAEAYAATKLQAVCRHAGDMGRFGKVMRQDAVAALDEALAAEREAIARIEAALALPSMAVRKRS